MCTQLYQDFGKKPHIKLQNSAEKTKTPAYNNNQKKQTTLMQKQWEATSVILHVAVMQGSTGITFDTGLSKCSILHNILAQPAAARLEPGQCSLALAAVFCESALSHSKNEGRKWSKGESWGKKEKNTPLRISLAQVKDIHVIFSKSGV